MLRAPCLICRVTTVAFMLLLLTLPHQSPSHAADQIAIPIPDNLPVNAAQVFRDWPHLPYGLGFPGSIRNRLSIEQIRQAVQQGEKGIVVDFSHVTKTLDGKPVSSGDVYGTVVCGPYPFESAETQMSYLRFRRDTRIADGRGVVDAAYFLKQKTNSEDWVDRGQIAIRMKLFHAQEGEDLDLGVYDTRCMFRRDGGMVRLLPSIVEGPSVNLVTSDDPTRCVIALRTSKSLVVRVTLDDGREFRSSVSSRRHEIEIDGLTADREYRYRVTVGDMTTRDYRLRTAPAKGSVGFRFAYGGDSREGAGFGLESHMGCNFLDLSRFAAFAYREDCRFLLQGGDLVNGYTTRPDDYRTQFYGWKHAVQAFHAERPVYAAMGNHECLVHHFDDGSKYGLRIDRWPYATHSSEVIYGEELVLPTDGPPAADPTRPTYRENVYSFQYGCVKCIAVNNNYWLCDRATQYGGSPEGYIMPDQLGWIQQELSEAEGDATVEYVIVFMQEPMLPNGGHIADAMWYHGDNNVRAGTWNGTELQREPLGIIQVRNELMRAIHASTKVAAVLGSDEHGYSKVKIDGKVPVGDPTRDDVNGDGWINHYGLDVNGDDQPDAVETASPLGDLRRPIWYLVGGGFGAPFYAREPTPWNEYWDDGRNPDNENFLYSSQPNILVFDVTETGIGVTVCNLYGETIDRIVDLMRAGS